MEILFLNKLTCEVAYTAKEIWKDRGRSEILTAVVMKTSIFKDITPCSAVNINRRFGGTSRLTFSGFRSKPSKKQA
jgi:hypothetical protein